MNIKDPCGRSGHSYHPLQLPRILARRSQKFSMLCVPLTVQNLNDWCRANIRRLRAVLSLVVGSQVRHHEPRRESKDFTLFTVHDRLSCCKQVHRSFARTVCNPPHAEARLGSWI